MYFVLFIYWQIWDFFFNLNILIASYDLNIISSFLEIMM